MSFDFNDAGPQYDLSEPIPAGEVVKLKGKLRPGGFDLDANGQVVRAPQGQTGWLTQSNSNPDNYYLSWEFTVQHGQYANRKIFENMTLVGGKLDEKGQSKAANISKAKLRAMIESAYGIDPNDESDAACQRRVIRSLGDLDGIEFVCKTRIEDGSPYKDHKTGEMKDGQKQNRIGAVLTVDKEDYQEAMGGQTTPQPAAPAAASQPQAAPQQNQQPSNVPAWAR